MKKLYASLGVIITTAFVLTACGSSPKAVADLLSTIQARGTLVISTDPAYPPQSALKANPQRTA
jgi:ABC-type amino acid transport substrate-binding protein